MPRLFTALEVPAEIAAELSLMRGGLPGARWIDPTSYHVTLRFIGDVDHAVARDVTAALGEVRHRAPVTVQLDGLSVFGGERPRALFVRVAPTPELARLQAEHEKLVRSGGVAPETRRFTPHVTLARLRDVRATEAAALIARHGRVPPLAFTASRFVLLSSRDAVGGGPYMVEAAYRLDAPVASPPSRRTPLRGYDPAASVSG